MSFTPKVSIVIPVYNGSDYLRDAIDSALAQTYPNIEIVVVNDGSQDEGATESIALSYGDKLRYFFKENGGVASALNHAIAEMTGDYFSWLSHDDLYYPNKIEAQFRALAGMDSDNTVIYSDFAIFSDNPDNVTEVRLTHVPPEQFRYSLAVGIALHGCTLLVPKEAFSVCGSFNEKLRTTQDYDLWFRLAEKYRFVHIPEVLVRARQHEAQGTRVMRGVVLDECNALLTGFAGRLSWAELTSAGHKTASLAYAEIADSCRQRDFDTAARYATDLALKSMVDGNLTNAARTIFMLTGVKPALLRWMHWLRRLFGFIWAGVKSMFRRIIKLLNPPGKRNLKDKFSHIYSENIFGGAESRSGGGSDMEQTAEIRRVLPDLLREFNVKSFMDAPCGDLFWIRATQLGVEKYIGVDIVEKLIEKNRLEFGDEAHEFICRNLAQDDLPCVDMIFCRDCLVHLNYEDVKRVLLNFKRSGSRYLLTTTFTGRVKNVDLIGDDIWRTLNLQVAPFNFPPPLRLINEQCTEVNLGFTDKSLGLWLLSDIEVT